MKLSERVGASLHSDPDSAAIEFEGNWWRWRDVLAVAGGLDEYLGPRGLGAATRVGLVARNRPRQVAAFAGALASERCIVMIYSAQSAEAIAADIRRLRLPVVVADVDDWTPLAVQAARDAGSLGLMLTRDDVEPVRPVPGLESLGLGVETRADPEVAMELLSSGTTSAPKRVPLLWATFEQAVEDAAAVYAAGGKSATRSPHVVFHPLGNIAGVSFLIPFLFQAHPLALLEKFKLPSWLDAVARHRPTRTSLPPAVLRMILDASVPRQAIASLVSVGVGAAQLDPLLQKQFEDTYGIALLPAYGATEFCGVVANWTLALHAKFGEAKRGSAGVARPGVSLRVVDGDTGRVAGVDAIGLLEAQVLRVGPEWVRTTDLARIDGDGFLFLHGRADNAINRGGFKVLPDDVARALRLHPGVADAAVIDLADARLGQVPVAAVEPREGVARPTEQDLLEFARQRLIAYQVPTRVLVVDALPRNPSMKVSLPALRVMFEQQ